MGKVRPKSMIHVCFSIYDKSGHYSKFLGTTLLSLFENTSSAVTIHILHDNYLTADNRNKFIYLARQYKQFIKFYNVDALCANRITKIREFFPEIDKTRFSIGMFYRFFIAHILPADIGKAIYLDSDIIVNMDITELWRVELGDKPFGAVTNVIQIKDEDASIKRIAKNINLHKAGFVKAEDYFNSGVLLLNLNFMRNADTTLINGMKFLRDNQQLQYLDQDVLNYCFANSILKLPIKFNRYVMLARDENELTIDKMIYHYAGGHLGLNLDMSDPFNRLWMNYFIKTPFFSVDTIDNMLKTIAQMDIEQSLSKIELSAMSINKPRAFVVEEENVNQVEIKFAVRYDEEIIIVDAKNEENLKQLLDLMNAERDKKVFFVGIASINPVLTGMGFVEGKHFFNIFASQEPSWTSLKNNYKLIMSM